MIKMGKKGKELSIDLPGYHCNLRGKLIAGQKIGEDYYVQIHDWRKSEVIFKITDTTSHNANIAEWADIPI
jgi:hypothetical protein